MEFGDTGYDVYILTDYRRTLQRQFRRGEMTHLSAINLGLDICSALSICRRAGYLYVDLKPANIHVLNGREYRIGDIGFVRMDSLKYASLPDRYRSDYTAPEREDDLGSPNTTIDTYALGKILPAEPLNNAVLGPLGGHRDDAVAFKRRITHDLEHHVLGDKDRADVILDLAFHGCVYLLAPCSLCQGQPLP